VNCVELLGGGDIDPTKPALSILGHAENDPRGQATFGDLLDQAGRIQTALLAADIRPGDSVLLFVPPSPALFAAVIAILGLGASVLLIEPFMPIGKIEDAVAKTKPKVFLTGMIGQIWGLRVGAIRRIPRWVRIRRALEAGGRHFQIERTEPETPGVITFTTGTTGHPKGVVRTQRALIDQNRILAKALHADQHTGPDLCIFANLALANLAQGRTSILVPGKWRKRHLKQISQLPDLLRPETLASGPAFLERLLRANPKALGALKSIHVGGALTDIGLMDEVFTAAPSTPVLHVYGSSEAEPVATIDARAAVQLSKARGYHQMLALGAPVPEIASEIAPEGVWVTGDHVCRFYVGSEKENAANKKKDESGRVWHFMGDRIQTTPESWWYAGRSFQRPEDFELEQKLYSFLKSSRSFIHRDPRNERVLIGEGLLKRAADIRRTFPEVDLIREAKIYRDARHRARIDRAKSEAKSRKESPL